MTPYRLKFPPSPPKMAVLKLCMAEHPDAQVDGQFDASGRSGEASGRLDDFLLESDPVQHHRACAGVGDTGGRSCRKCGQGWIGVEIRVVVCVESGEDEARQVAT